VQYKALAILSAVNVAAIFPWHGWPLAIAGLLLGTACGASAGFLWHYSCLATSLDRPKM
jgi:hypothetical protein